MREEIISPPFREGLPFCVLMTGTSYCDGSYRVYRPVSDLTCIEYVVSGHGAVHCGGQTVYPQGGICIFCRREHSTITHQTERIPG